jgi:RNA polymerase sigma-70 factor (ECF subfamily)
LAEEVKLALAELRAEYRQAFVLFHEQELAYSEIAAAMGVPLGTIKTWVHRARRELIDHLHQRGAIPHERHRLVKDHLVSDHAVPRV